MAICPEQSEQALMLRPC